MRVLITGGTGFLGQALAERLLADGHGLRLMSRSGPGEDVLASEGVDYPRGSVIDPTAVREATVGCDAVVHLAGGEDVPLLPRDDRYARGMFEVNVLGTQHVLNAASEAGVQRTVVVSSCTTFGHAGDGIPNDGARPYNINRMDSKYVGSRLQQELVCLEAAARGQDVVVACPSVIVGPGDRKGSARAIDAFRRGRIPAVPPGGYNFIAIEDVVEGLVAALLRGHPGRRYLLVHENLTFRELFARVGRVVDRPPPRVLPRTAVSVADWISRSCGPLFGLHLSFRNADALLVERFYFDARVAVEELDLPQTPIDSAIERTVRWLQSR